MFKNLIFAKSRYCLINRNINTLLTQLMIVTLTIPLVKTSVASLIICLFPSTLIHWIKTRHYSIKKNIYILTICCLIHQFFPISSIIYIQYCDIVIVYNHCSLLYMMIMPLFDKCSSLDCSHLIISMAIVTNNSCSYRL